MADTPGPALAARFTLRFASTDALAEALAVYAGPYGSGGLCLQALKYYELGDRVQLRLEIRGEPLGIHAVVAWRKPGFIGVRFHPTTAGENQVFGYLRQLLADAREKPRAPVPPPVSEAAKPFAD